MIPGREYTPDEVLWVVWGRRWVVFVAFVLVSTATVVISNRLPERFRAEMLILTVPQSPSGDLRGAPATPIKDRLPTISQQILSRTRLERIIQDLDLFADARRTGSMQAVVERMRGNIHIEIVEGSQSFRVSYEAESPSLAMLVTERLGGLFIEENSHDRAALAHETSAFLESQLEDARRRLGEQEKRLEAYRQRYRAELPTRLQLNIQAVQSTQTQIQALNDALNKDRDRRLLLARQLANLQSEQSAVSSTVPEQGSQGSTIPAQLETALSELRALELRLTPQHPDVVRAKQLVADRELKAQSEAAPSSKADARSKALPASEIARRNRLNELQVELDTLDQQIANKVVQEPKLRIDLQTYQARVDGVATREAELASLTRDYDALQNLYRTLLARSEDSKIAENLERRQVGAQFKIVDPPRRPERPFRPNRPLINLAGALGGLALGIALAALVEFRDKSVKVEADVHAALDLPVLALIPAMPSVAERRKAHWRKVGLSIVVGMVVAMCATAVWLTFAFR